jgi:predicted phosphodiesterase
MKIQYASDLHLEFPSNTYYIIDNPLKVTGDILILAGDIHVINSEKYLENPFWDWASKNYKQVIIAYGNHEFYNDYDLSTMKDGFKLKIRENIYYYYNCVISIDDIDIIVSTLWSYIQDKNKKACEDAISDFKLIKWGEETLTADLFNKEHKRCLDFVKKSLNESKAKTKIVVTHHVPSSLLVAKEFQGSDVNEAFTVDLTDFIKKCGAKYWIYGHSHRNINKVIGKTSCLCNQVGYISYNEQETFNNEVNIDLNKKSSKCNLI